MKISRAFKNDRLLKSVTGVSKLEFENLLPRFEQALASIASNKKRQRAVGGGRKGSLSDARTKLFFILFYLKTYPTFDLASFLFSVDRSRPCRWVKALLPVLEKTLGYACVLPKRKVTTMDEFLKYFPEVKDLLVDGTERRTQRPSSSKNQKRRYSGKKRSHTRKNIVGVSENREILLLSPTKNGNRHDKRRLEQTGWLKSIPDDVTLWGDMAFIGVEDILPPGVTLMRPQKKSKHHPLTEAQKSENKAISSLRIRVEHAIGGAKRFNALTHVYRNRRGQDDQFIYLASGLWNFHLHASL